MNATVDTGSLRQLAERCARVPGRNPRDPIYAAVLLDAGEDGRVTGYATDGDTWLRDSTPGTIEVAGRVAVSAKLLAGLAGVLPAGAVRLASAGTGLEITRPGTRDRWTLPGLHAEDYPTWPADPAGQIVSVAAAALAPALDLVGGVTAAADAAVRGLRQIELTADGAGLTLRGTDRYRFVGAVVPAEQPVTGSAQVVVAPEVAAVLGPLTREYDRVSLLFPEGTGGLMAVSAGPVRLLTPLLDADSSATLRGTLRRYLASAWADTFDVDRRELVEQLERASWAIDGGPVMLALEPDGDLTITAQGDKDARDGLQTMQASIPPGSGLAADGVEVGARAAYLIHAAKAYRCDTVRIAVNPKRQALAVSDPAGDSAVRYGLMAQRRMTNTGERAA